MIILVRHGKSACEASYRRATGHEMTQLLAAYDAAGIAEGSFPSEEVATLARQTALVVSSDLPRAMASAARLTGARAPVIDPMFREPVLPAVGLGKRLCAPPALWVGVLRIFWLMRIQTGTVESPRAVWARAHAAATTLIALSLQHGRVMLVGHCLFNFLVGLILIRRGWLGPARLQGHWGFGVYLRRAQAPPAA
jgi:broad specificity phosphatase PhoE